MKQLPEKAVYSDVINSNLILPCKRKYTINDFRKLLAEGWSQIDARWIVMCSAVFWNADLSNQIGSAKFLDLCELGLAHL